MRKIARARLKDSETLFQNKRYNGAIYLCGYAIEIALKHRICKTLHWDGYPFTNKEFDDLRSFRTYDLDTLLKLSGIEKRIKKEFHIEWSVVSLWDPQVRYETIGRASRSIAEQMINSTITILRKL
ncbi:MAG: HEPN domain-containing protein [candidate division Zixibacteria bacterium]|nr:HEPN domain-containing protein [Candidatus Tariuqbacter arcticus]